MRALSLVLFLLVLAAGVAGATSTARYAGGSPILLGQPPVCTNTVAAGSCFIVNGNGRYARVAIVDDVFGSDVAFAAYVNGGLEFVGCGTGLVYIASVSVVDVLPLDGAAAGCGATSPTTGIITVT